MTSVSVGRGDLDELLPAELILLKDIGVFIPETLIFILFWGWEWEVGTIPKDPDIYNDQFDWLINIIIKFREWEWEVHDLGIRKSSWVLVT